MSYSIDLQKIADELEFDLEDVEMLLEVFLDSTNTSLKELKNAIEDIEFEDIYRCAHTIKGSAANLRLEEISTAAKYIETSARERQNIDYLGKYNQLEILIKDLKS